MYRVTATSHTFHEAAGPPAAYAGQGSLIFGSHQMNFIITVNPSNFCFSWYTAYSYFKPNKTGISNAMILIEIIFLELETVQRSYLELRSKRAGHNSRTKHIFKHCVRNPRFFCSSKLYQKCTQYLHFCFHGIG